MNNFSNVVATKLVAGKTSLCRWLRSLLQISELASFLGPIPSFRCQCEQGDFLALETSPNNNYIFYFFFKLTDSCSKIWTTKINESNRICVEGNDSTTRTLTPAT